MNVLLIAASFLAVTAQSLGPGDHNRTLDVNGQSRSYLVHVPPKYDAQRPTPVVLAFHGAATNAAIMAQTTGLSGKADEAGFIVVYPNGTGKAKLLLIWNSGGYHGPGAETLPNDVVFVEAILDDLAKMVRVDPKRVYATGISNGGMMCYRLAAELSQRIAAIAPVAGALGVERCQPRRPVPVLHFHGTEDKLVPFHGPDEKAAKFWTFKSVDETIRIWTRIDDCPTKPKTIDIPDKVGDGTTIREEIYGPGREGTEVLLYVVNGGGHTWPGRQWPIPWLGNTTKNISANDLMWDSSRSTP